MWELWYYYHKICLYCQEEALINKLRRTSFMFMCSSRCQYSHPIVSARSVYWHSNIQWRSKLSWVLSKEATSGYTLRTLYAEMWFSKGILIWWLSWSTGNTNAKRRQRNSLVRQREWHWVHDWLLGHGHQGYSIYCNERKRQSMPGWFTAKSDSDNIIDCNNRWI